MPGITVRCAALTAASCGQISTETSTPPTSTTNAAGEDERHRTAQKHTENYRIPKEINPLSSNVAATARHFKSNSTVTSCDWKWYGTELVSILPVVLAIFHVDFILYATSVGWDEILRQEVSTHAVCNERVSKTWGQWRATLNQRRDDGFCNRFSSSDFCRWNLYLTWVMPSTQHCRL